VDWAKPYNIPKREVWEAYRGVRADQGAAGVDGHRPFNSEPLPNATPRFTKIRLSRHLSPKFAIKLPEKYLSTAKLRKLG
jgi:hypothetical protein